MGLLTRTQPTQVQKKTATFKIGTWKNKITESILGKGQTGKIPIRTKFQGEPPLENYEENERIVREVPLMAGIINKTVDWVVGPGFFLDSTDQEAINLVEDWFEKINIDLFLRNVTTQGLTYGNSYSEILNAREDENPLSEIILFDDLKLWDPKTITVEMDKQKNKVNYIQSTGMGESIRFELDEMVHFRFNEFGDSPYGLSLIDSVKTIIHYKTKAEEDFALLINRKANSPMIWQLGNDENPANESDVTAFSDAMQHLRNNQEWAVSHLAQPRVKSLEEYF